MKKLITLLASTSLIVGAGATAISCGNDKTETKKENKISEQENVDKKLKEFFKKYQNVEIKCDDVKDLYYEEAFILFFSYLVKEQAKLKDDHIFKHAFLDMCRFYDDEDNLKYLKENRIFFVALDDELDKDKDCFPLEVRKAIKKENKIEVKKIGEIILKFKWVQKIK